MTGLTMDAARKAAAMTYLYGAYDKPASGVRYSIYCNGVVDVPVAVLERTVRKLAMTEDYLPSLAKLLRTARQEQRHMLGIPEPKSFEAARDEIIRGLNKTWYVGCMGEVPRSDPNWGRPCKPVWSSPAVEALYKQFYSMLRVAEENDTALFAQMRRAYEQILAREDEQRLNKVIDALSGDNGAGMMRLVGGVKDGCGQ